MAKQKTIFVCLSCGYEAVRWLGKCPSCSEWNTLIEQIQSIVKPCVPTLSKSIVQKLSEIQSDSTDRFSTGIDELDRVLGAGIVPGSLLLLSGDPGIGKSTLLLQVSGNIAAERNVLYITAEESAPQIKMRADRLDACVDNLYIYAENQLTNIINTIAQLNPDFVVVDSIQTVYWDELSSVQGSVSQVKECTGRLMRIAKETGCTILLIGHVTKEGAIAGPKVLEHMVDTVLYFEGDKQSSYRMLRAVKNRFGSTNELGMFEMTHKGMQQVLNPSELLLSSRNSSIPGTAVFCAMEGTRPILAEVQALVTKSNFAAPRRTATGMDYNRLVMLLATLEKRLNYPLYDKDVYINIAGGFYIAEPAADLAVLCAVVSCMKNIPLPMDAVFIGEVGLTGELRYIPQLELRLKEAKKQGFNQAIVSKAAAKNLSVQDFSVIAMDTLKDSIKYIFME